MPAFDIPLDELETYRNPEPAPPDLVAFWTSTIAEARRHDLAITRTRVDTGLRLSVTYDLEFAGFDGQRVKAWLQVPADLAGPVPAVVQYHGYSCGRSMPLSSHWVEAGYAHLQLDTRGQGWFTASSFPLTPDAGPDAGANSYPGFMVRGWLSPETYYYRRVYTDAVRLVDAARTLPEIDPTGVLLHGGSQGGGMTIATSGILGMLGESPVGAMPDVPFLCHFGRGVDLAMEGPYPEIERWLFARPEEAEDGFATLRYFDGTHLAPYAQIPALFSAGLRDMVCPPSTVFAAYNAWSGRKSIELYPWNGHEGGRELQSWKQVRWAHDVLGV